MGYAPCNGWRMSNEALRSLLFVAMLSLVLPQASGFLVVDPKLLSSTAFSKEVHMNW